MPIDVLCIELCCADISAELSKMAQCHPSVKKWYDPGFDGQEQHAWPATPLLRNGVALELMDRSTMCVQCTFT